jgi:glycine oxidase
MSRVVVVGGGVCGLGVGWKLAKSGVDVTLFERGEPCREATWASAGMLAAHMELRPKEENLTFLGRESLRRWKAFAAELEADAGSSVDYRDEGTLFVALDRDAAEHLRFLNQHQRDIGLPVEALSGYEARQREPHLSRNVVAALYSAEDHQVDARALGAALESAFARYGGALRSKVSVERVLVEDGRAVGVQANGERFAADAVVVAAGAWSGLLDGIPEPAKPPVRPVKGQIVVLEQPSPPIVDHCVWAMVGPLFSYLAPKSDGRLVIGATVEEMGFDKRVTAGGLLDLLRPAWETLPAIHELPVLEVQAGLRPGSRDSGPILGATPVPGVFMATGHYRNGILFAPVTAEDVSRAVLTGETTETIRPFSVERFAR